MEIDRKKLVLKVWLLMIGYMFGAVLLGSILSTLLGDVYQ